MKRITAQIAVHDYDSQGHFKFTPVAAWQLTPNFVAHRPYSAVGAKWRHWQITHVGTGLACGYEVPTLVDANQAALLLEEVHDWSAVRVVTDVPSAIHIRCRDIIRAFAKPL